MNRRHSLGLMGTLLAAVALRRMSHATTARAVSLTDLVARSSRVARGTPLEGFSRFEDIGDTRHIVTYTRLRVDELIHGAPSEPEMLVRTLGGRVGTLGEIVHGEAVLALDESCVAFLQTNSDGIDQVTEMAQGHYRLLTDPSGTTLLRPSLNLPRLMPSAGAAVQQLSGLELGAARALILGARR